MRLVFCGSGAFAVPSLRAIAAAEREIAEVVTQPARPSGRGRKLTATEVARAAAPMGLKLQEVADINAPPVVEHLRSLGPDVICVVDFGQYIGRAVREIPRSIFNLHGSLLPELRGAAPVNWALIRGYSRTGVTTFEVVAAMDAGPVYLQRAIDIEADEEAPHLAERLADLGAEAVCETLDLLDSGQVEPSPQDQSKATFARKLRKSDGRIDWSAGAAPVCNLVRGCRPWPGAQALYLRPGRSALTVGIERARARPGGVFETGVVDDQWLVGTPDGRVEIEQVKPAGKRAMSWRDFVNGYRVKPGDRFANMSASRD